MYLGKIISSAARSISPSIGMTKTHFAIDIKHDLCTLSDSNLSNLHFLLNLNPPKRYISIA